MITLKPKIAVAVLVVLVLAALFAVIQDQKSRADTRREIDHQERVTDCIIANAPRPGNKSRCEMDNNDW